ncbi:Carboxylic ester hydrolase [Aphelenchoides besseyi]|nr:Carboxylic ester hydrolase [Aphelenchoides besseyi]
MYRKGPPLLQLGDEEENDFIEFKSTGSARRIWLWFCLQLFFVLLFYKMQVQSPSTEPEVKLDVGRIRGKRESFSGGQMMDVFYGVPFAEVPTGQNRFEKTVPKKPWDGILKTVEHKPLCYPIMGDAKTNTFSEDCLYLNVYRPVEIKTLLPIMFIVHGGAYETGTALRYANVQEIGHKFVSKYIIVVAIQYRLAVLGFASTGDDEMKGNFGYFDQLEALRFVHRNALAFGGDLDRITVFGCSAGGSSVNALSVSPHSRDMVYQVISMSGSPFAAWTTSENSVKNTKLLVDQLGKKDGESVKQRLKRATMKEIYDALNRIGTTKFGVNFVNFGPRLDGDFLPKDYPELISETAPKKDDHGMCRRGVFTNSSTAAMTIQTNQIAGFSSREVERLVDVIVREGSFRNVDEVKRKVLEFYLNSNEEEKNNVFYLQRYTQILSDLQFNLPIVRDIIDRRARGWSIFAYKSTYVNPEATTERCPIKKSFHGMDQRYMILGYGEDRRFKMTDDDHKMENLLVDTFVNFVKTSSPTTNHFDWKPVQTVDSLDFASLQPNPTMNGGLFLDRLKFWRSLAEDYKYDLVRMLPQEKNKT